MIITVIMFFVGMVIGGAVMYILKDQGVIENKQ